MSPPSEKRGESRLAAAGLLLGPLLAGLAALALEGVRLEPGARAAIVLALWMAVWWVTEALPLPITSLLPLVFLPATGARSFAEAAVPFADSAIFLFLGGFLLAASIESCGLHRVFARVVLRAVGTRPDRIVAGFLLVAAALSMWISNTATAVLLMPIALSVVPEHRARPGGGDLEGRFATCALIAVAWGCSIGGIATPTGTPPNALLIGFLERDLGVEISFGRWMILGLALTCTLLPAAWWLLVRVLFPLPRGATYAPPAGLGDVLQGEVRLTTRQRRCLAAFSCVAALWIVRGFLPAGTLADGLNRLGDSGIAMAGGLALFALPSGEGGGERLLDWDAARRRVPWGVLLLLGGGLSLAAAIQDTGASGALSGLLPESEVPGWALLLGVVTLVVFLTELTSNTATANVLYPVVAAAAIGIGQPELPLLVGVCCSCSLAFMLPAATPPNAVVFGSGHVTIGQMARAGFLMNLVGAGLVTLLVQWLVPFLVPAG